MALKYKVLAFLTLILPAVSTPHFAVAASDSDLLYHRQGSYQLNSSRYQSNALGKTDLPSGFMNASPVAGSSFSSSAPCQTGIAPSSGGRNAVLGYENTYGTGGLVQSTYDYGRSRPVYRSAQPNASIPCNPQTGIVIKKPKTVLADVPEPSALALVGLGLMGYALCRKKGKSAL